MKKILIVILVLSGFGLVWMYLNADSSNDQLSDIEIEEQNQQSSNVLKEYYGDSYGEDKYTNSTFGYSFMFPSQYYTVSGNSEQSVTLHTDDPELLTVAVAITNPVENFSQSIGAIDSNYETSELNGGTLFQTGILEKVVGSQGRIDLESYVFWEEKSTGRLLMIELSTVIDNLDDDIEYESKYNNLDLHKQAIAESLLIVTESFLEPDINDMTI